MRNRWQTVFGAAAIFCVDAELAFSASPVGTAVETETIILQLGEDEKNGPGLRIPNESEYENEASDDEPVEQDTEPDHRPDKGPPPVIEYDASKLPPPVRRLREQILEAATSGEIDGLRPIFDANGEPPAISFNEDGDPINQLKSLSGDEEGREILAILIEVLEAGYVHVDVGTPDEMYVWPYFARYPLEELTGPQMVELFKLLTAGDYEDMKIYGTYLFYRVGIAPNGVWRFFLAGD